MVLETDIFHVDGLDEDDKHWPDLSPTVYQNHCLQQEQFRNLFPTMPSFPRPRSQVFQRERYNYGQADDDMKALKCVVTPNLKPQSFTRRALDAVIGVKMTVFQIF